MKILKLTCENVKKLTVVEITPDGNLVQITGKNGAGKTSVLDAILKHGATKATFRRAAKRTAMYQELLAVRERWSKWRHRWNKDLPGPDHEAQADKVSESLDEMQESLRGPNS